MHHNLNNSGSARLIIFDAELDPGASPPYDKYVGQTNTFSLVWQNHADPLVELYAHDEVTPGGILIATSALSFDPQPLIDAIVSLTDRVTELEETLMLLQQPQELKAAHLVELSDVTFDDGSGGLAPLVATIPVPEGATHFSVQNQGVMAIEYSFEDAVGSESRFLQLERRSSANSPTLAEDIKLTIPQASLDVYVTRAESNSPPEFKVVVLFTGPAAA